jgi:hypothetical protein
MLDLLCPNANAALKQIVPSVQVFYACAREKHSNILSPKYRG